MASSPELVRRMNDKYDWKNILVPIGALTSEEELRKAIAEGKQIHVALPHMLVLWINVTVTCDYIFGPKLNNSRGHLDLQGANLKGRIDYNANFVFSNYWHAWAYINKFENP